MWETLLVAIIGGIVASYCGHFFKSADKTSQYIEEAFLLSNQIYDYALIVLNQIVIQVGLFKSNGDLSSLNNLKQVENPFPRLIMIMELHLHLPEELLNRLSGLQNEILISFRPIAESFSKSNNKDDLYSKAIISSTEGVNKARELSNNLLVFIRERNLSLKNTTYLPNILSLMIRPVHYLAKKFKGSSKKLIKSD